MAKKNKLGPFARHGAYWDGSGTRSCLEALAAFAGVAAPGPKPTTEETIESDAQFWRSVAIVLAAEKWPAFRLPPKLTGKILDKTGAADWLEAGGTRENMPTFFDDFYAAQFVIAIEGLRNSTAKTQRRTRNEVFKSLAGQTSQAQNKREVLPAPYRNRTTIKSLKEAFERISNDIQQDPEQHLPTKQPITAEGFTGDVPWALVARKD
jgi:hypothetical protein